MHIAYVVQYLNVFSRFARDSGGVTLSPNKNEKAGKTHMMKTGFRGTFVISWSQTEIDGLRGAPAEALTAGAAWAWHGEALRVDGPNDVLRLDQAKNATDLRKKAARMVERLVGDALEDVPPRRRSLDTGMLDDVPLMDDSFVVTDGRQTFTVTLIHVGSGTPPLLMFLDAIPPVRRELWIVHRVLDRPPAAVEEGGVICFTPGTTVQTPEGARLIEELREGDLVSTKDNGPQPVRWIGQRHLSGARLFASPKLRPIRIEAGVFGADRPDQLLIVSPEHRIIIRGPVAQDLFNTSEVLVAAKDLIDGRAVSVDLTARAVTYVHLLFDQHQVMWANGVETESFHPASAALTALAPADRARLTGVYPELGEDPYAYGNYARRNLTTSEAAILRHAA